MLKRIREYETIYVLRPDISDLDAERVTDRVLGILRSHDGTIIEVNNWGKRRLAYEVAKHQKGIYLYWRYLGNSNVVAELERNLRMLEPIVRFLTVKLDDKPDVAAAEDIDDEEIPKRASKEGRRRDRRDSKPEAAKASEAKAGEAKAGDAKAGDAKAGDAKAGGAKAGEAKAGEAKAGEAKSGNDTSAEKPAAKAVAAKTGNEG